MPEIRIRPRAQSDLKAIWRYSFQQWGERQADLYLKQLDDGIQSLRDFPEVGEPCDDIRAGYRKLQVSRHPVPGRSRTGAAY
jgi:toxin ParE1/3/4